MLTITTYVTIGGLDWVDRGLDTEGSHRNGREGRKDTTGFTRNAVNLGPHHIRAITITVTIGGLDWVDRGGGPLTLVYDGLARLDTEGSHRNGREGRKGTTGFTRNAVNL